MLCPHCSNPIDLALLRQAVNKAAASGGKGSRPGAKGLVRNPKGRKKKSQLHP